MVSSIMKQQLGSSNHGMANAGKTDSNVQILELLGAGGSAKVYRGVSPPSVPLLPPPSLSSDW